MKRIFINCTNTHANAVTGISRVIINIIKYRSLIREFGNYKIICFIYKNGELFEIKPEDILKATNEKRSLLYKLRESWANKLFQLLSRKRLIYLKHFLKIVVERKLIDKIIGQFYTDSLDKTLEFSPGVDFLLLGECPEADTVEIIDLAILNKLKIISIIYDLIPITYPQFNKNKIESFNLAINKLLSVSKLNVSISKFTNDCLKSYAKFLQSTGVPLFSGKYFYFDLGSDFSLVNKDYATSKFIDVFSSKGLTFLVCGTIEPRKNHLNIVRAFEKLWEKNCNIKLLIIGREGWDIASILDYIKNHKELGKRLFLFHNVDDKELSVAYRNSEALIFASFVEGFGLPLVEAEGHGLPVLCSDIPVFHEVMGNRGAYFNPYDPDDISSKIESFLASPKSISTVKSVITTWEQSVRQLFSIITKEIGSATD